MKLEHDFVVPVTLERAWALLLDLERVVPCMPGAELTGIEGDTFSARVKVKVGAIQMTYQGRGEFVERDHDAGHIVMRAQGTDTRGAGSAKATVTASMSRVEGGTKVDVATDLVITGRAAQFGRGVISDVTDKIIGQFVENLRVQVLSSDSGSAATATPDGVRPNSTTAVTTTATVPDFLAGPQRAASEPLDLGSVAFPALVKRVGIPAVGAVLLAAVVVYFLTR